MQSTGTVKRSHDQIQSLFEKGDKLEGSQVDLQDLSRIVSKMPARHQKENIQLTIAKLFDIASAKMKDDHDK